jgi:hypothetical protein
MNKDNKWNERVVPAGRPMADTSGRDHGGGDECSLTQDPVEAVRAMKDRAATSMRTIGSLTLLEYVPALLTGPPSP